MARMSARNVFSMLEQTATRYGSQPALHQPGKPQHVYSWSEFLAIVKEVAAGLYRLGIRKGDICAAHSETRAEFYFADLGVMSLGAISAALYTSYPAAQLVKSLRQSEAKLVFVENAKALHMLRDAGADALSVQWVLLTGEAEDAITLDHLRHLGQRQLQEDAAFDASISSRTESTDHAILYLTSGATGESKMCLVTHGALTSNCAMGPKVVDLGPHDRVLAFLPSAHIAQRIGIELLSIYCGVPTWFSEGLHRMPHEMQTLKPTFFLAPPRVWERIYSSVCTEIKKRGPAMQRVFWGALGLSLRAQRYRAEGKSVPGWMSAALKAADRVVFTKLRARFGGEMRFPVSGAAPLGKDLAHFYEAIGMPLHEGYGLTEAGVVSLNPLGHPRPGSIGRALPGIECRIAEDGELLIGGPTLFSGYFRDPDATAQVLRDGWLHTGDLASQDADGFLSIIGRKKEMIVSSNGKKVYPSRIENLLKMESIFNQMILVGDRKPYVAALFTLNAAAAESLKGMEGRKGIPAKELADAVPVQAEVKRAVKKANQQLGPFEQIRKYRILDRDFTIEHGELTATMKVRRTQVIEHFQHVINEIYSGREDGD
ncbi:MAG: long-chain fatty acid--CoA ligase [Candidatus Solibacter usitatus]|nr:long-chain fatty acid--CoA ligase [Candidatus Solibacter usitatus]